MNPEELEDEVNTEFDEGTSSFSADGNTMYYTYCSQDETGDRTSEIYVSTRSSAKWGKGTRTTIVKDSVTALGHPAISPDGKYLYFTSDVVGGFGGKDLYRARVAGSDFGPMENLGPEINTTGDEMFPYVRDSVTIYFASNGHPGAGGLDLFKATQDSTGHWKVENLGFPINSSSDDFGITFEGNKEKGFFSSNRNDARGFDHIYSFEKPTITVRIEGIVNDVDENGNVVKKMMHDTSVGRVIVNELVPDEAGYINTIISKKSLRDIISHVIKVCGVSKAADFLDGIKNLGYYMAFKGGLSFNLGDIIIPKE